MAAVSVGWDVAPEVAHWAGLPAVSEDLTADACVVGLGASGIAAVESLVDRGLSVVGVDRGRVASGAAGRNGGFLISGSAAFLHVAIAAWGEQPALEIYRETMAELDRLEAELGSDVVSRSGSIRLAGLPGRPSSDEEVHDRESELADCAAQAEALLNYGFAVEEYDGELGLGLFLPGDGATNPALRVMLMANRLQGRARLFEHTNTVSVQSGRVITEGGTISAGVVIVAVDGGLEMVLPALAGRVRTARLQMLATEPIAPGRLPCPVYARWGYDYAQQRADGRLFVGGGRDQFVEDEWTADPSTTPEVQRWIESVAERMAGVPVTPAYRWAASVGYTADGRPLCAKVADRVVGCGGYSGTGNLVGPITARAAVAYALDGTAPPPYMSS